MSLWSTTMTAELRKLRYSLASQARGEIATQAITLLAYPPNLTAFHNNVVKIKTLDFGQAWLSGAIKSEYFSYC